MKVLLFDKTLSFITPGGKTIHAIKLHKELNRIGVQVEFAQWWNKGQSDYDIIHSLAHQVENLVDFSHKYEKKVILTHIMDKESNKSIFKQYEEIIITKIQSFFPFTMEKIQGLKAIPKFDHIVYMNEFDRNTAFRYYKKINPTKTSIIPHAYDPSDMYISKNYKLNINLPERFLISCANIDSRKQSHLLAQYAKLANVPVVFIGGSDVTDPYFKKFINEIDNKYTFYLGYVDSITKDYLEQKAIGFALLSLAESGCIAVYEAAAYKLPLFLSNLPWAKGYDTPNNITFCDFRNKDLAIHTLADFFNNTCNAEKSFPFNVLTWAQVAEKYKKIYQSFL